MSLPGADFTPGDPPASADAGVVPPITVEGSGAATNGGTTTLRIRLEGTPEAPLFIVVIDGDSGYFTAAATDEDGDGVYEIEIQIGNDVDVSSLTVRVAPVDEHGNVGQYESVTYEVIRTGVGDVKVTLAWDQDTDLDLHVVEPNGFEIFFGEPASPTGGELDLDSNAECKIDGTNIENVYWPTNKGPSGTYTVFVTNFATCGSAAPEVRYTVTVTNSSKVETFRGSFASDTVEEKRQIATFVH